MAINKQTMNSPYVSTDGAFMKKLQDMIVGIELTEATSPGFKGTDSNKLNNQLASGQAANNEKAMANAANKATTSAANTTANATTTAAATTQASAVEPGAGEEIPTPAGTAPQKPEVTVDAGDVEDAAEEQLV